MEANPIVLDDTAGDVVVVVVEGEHDIYTAPTLRERLDEALDRGGGIVVDLTAATFVDSSVLGALLDARRRALEAGQGFVVCVGRRSSGRSADPRHHRLVPVLPSCGSATSDRGAGRTARTHEQPARGPAHDARPRRGRGRAKPGAGRHGRTRSTSRRRCGRHEDGRHRGCTNVVVHAYEADDGVLEVEMRARGRADDRRPRPRARAPARLARLRARALGLGLPLIAALSETFELRGSAGAGTEVRMTFSTCASRTRDANPCGDRRNRRPLGPRRSHAENRKGPPQRSFRVSDIPWAPH